jgi:hypothetical protein
MSRYDNFTETDICKEAMNVQDACNLSGLAHSLPEIIVRLGQLSIPYRAHPAVRLWVSKMESLANGECCCERCTNYWADAYNQCKDIVGG